jgi:putative tricarboxylic transport membrane protein
MSRQSAVDTSRPTRPPLDSKRKGRLVVGGVGLVLGLWFTWYTWANVPMGTQERPGAGVFPLVVGIAMAGVSVLTLAEAWLTDAVSGELSFPEGKKRRVLLLMAVALVAFVGLYQTLGQYIASSLFMIAGLSLLGSRSMVRNIVYGTAIGVGISAFFMELLSVRLPDGLLGPTGLIGGLFL